MYTNVKFAYMYIHTYIKFYIYIIHIRISNTLKVYLYPTLNTGSPAFLLKVLSVPLAKVFKSNPSYIHYMSSPVLGFEDSMITDRFLISWHLHSGGDRHLSNTQMTKQERYRL